MVEELKTTSPPSENQSSAKKPVIPYHSVLSLDIPGSSDDEASSEDSGTKLIIDPEPQSDNAPSDDHITEKTSKVTFTDNKDTNMNVMTDTNKTQGDVTLDNQSVGACESDGSSAKPAKDSRQRSRGRPRRTLKRGFARRGGLSRIHVVNRMVHKELNMSSPGESESALKSFELDVRTEARKDKKYEADVAERTSARTDEQSPVDGIALIPPIHESTAIAPEETSLEIKEKYQSDFSDVTKDPRYSTPEGEVVINPTKRKRGRPRKIKWLEITRSSPIETESISKKKVNEMTLEVTVKKKRGRPRKFRGGKVPQKPHNLPLSSVESLAGREITKDNATSSREELSTCTKLTSSIEKSSSPFTDKNVDPSDRIVTVGVNPVEALPLASDREEILKVPSKTVDSEPNWQKDTMPNNDSKVCVQNDFTSKEMEKNAFDYSVEERKNISGSDSTSTGAIALSPKHGSSVRILDAMSKADQSLKDAGETETLSQVVEDNAKSPKHDSDTFTTYPEATTLEIEMKPNSPGKAKIDHSHITDTLIDTGKVKGTSLIEVSENAESAPSKMTSLMGPKGGDSPGEYKIHFKRYCRVTLNDCAKQTENGDLITTYGSTSKVPVREALFSGPTEAENRTEIKTPQSDGDEQTTEMIIGSQFSKSDQDQDNQCNAPEHSDSDAQPTVNDPLCESTAHPYEQTEASCEQVPDDGQMRICEPGGSVKGLSEEQPQELIEVVTIRETGSTPTKQQETTTSETSEPLLFEDPEPWSSPASETFEVENEAAPVTSVSIDMPLNSSVRERCSLTVPPLFTAGKPHKLVARQHTLNDVSNLHQGSRTPLNCGEDNHAIDTGLSCDTASDSTYSDTPNFGVFMMESGDDGATSVSSYDVSAQSAESGPDKKAIGENLEQGQTSKSDDGVDSCSSRQDKCNIFPVGLIIKNKMNDPHEPEVRAPVQEDIAQISWNSSQAPAPEITAPIYAPHADIQLESCAEVEIAQTPTMSGEFEIQNGQCQTYVYTDLQAEMSEHADFSLVQRKVPGSQHGAEFYSGQHESTEGTSEQPFESGMKVHLRTAYQAGEYVILDPICTCSSDPLVGEVCEPINLSQSRPQPENEYLGDLRFIPTPESVTPSTTPKSSAKRVLTRSKAKVIEQQSESAVKRLKVILQDSTLPDLPSVPSYAEETVTQTPPNSKPTTPNKPIKAGKRVNPRPTVLKATQPPTNTPLLEAFSPQSPSGYGSSFSGPLIVHVAQPPHTSPGDNGRVYSRHAKMECNIDEGSFSPKYEPIFEESIGSRMRKRKLTFSRQSDDEEDNGKTPPFPFQIPAMPMSPRRGINSDNDHLMELAKISKPESEISPRNPGRKVAVGRRIPTPSSTASDSDGDDDK